MSQLNLFGLSDSEGFGKKDTRCPARWELWVDGAARNNPGPAGAGIYLTCEEKDVLKEGYFLGSRTNNEAEYLALLLGVALASEHMKEHDMLEIISDSQLMVKQVLGLFKVRKPELQRLHQQVLRFLRPMRYQIRHVMREHNGVADKLANKGVDEKRSLPPALQKTISLLL
jgi:ribonuclease HI